ncbi:hypothetical protein [Undibacterium luofuense]|uniref:Uncharacterized protein n=1 Tax=Undibacterium luofuense TaxID=2828733 RepID=A0A941DQN2_9BURK|nr:hypothetical protein [Undibacterium luofuense]MBR7784054.1 hypothetical protein [Undibacterium luofuense]
MHDWTLKNVNFEWELARVVLELNDSVSAVRTLVADGVTELSVPRNNAWGSSVSVNDVHEIEELPSGLKQLKIEMQSGDVIQIVAAKFALPFDGLTA